MPNAPITQGLAEWLCAHRYDAIPPRAREKTVDVIFDSVGCMTACSTLPEIKAIVEFATQMGGGESTIIGHGTTVSAVSAALANGAMAHGDEVDPVHLASVGGHVASGPVPTGLVVGEMTNASGRDVAHAIALGYEVGGRLMAIFYRERNYVQRRFYHTAIAANITSAITAGLLLKLKPEQLQVAMGLGTYQAAGPDNMMRDPRHFGKTFQVGAANRNGVTAALLAQRGCHVPLDILDGTLGLFDTYLNKPELGPELIEKLGSYYAITDVMHKRYPVGTPNQTYCQGLFSLFEQHPLTNDEIENIEIHMPSYGLYTLPETRNAAIAAKTVSAVAVLERKLDFYRLHGTESVITPALRKIQEKIRFIPRDDWRGVEHNRHAIVRISTKTGKKVEEEVWFKPMTRPELERKFQDLAVPRVGKERTEQLRTLLLGIEDAASIRPLMQILRAI